MSKRSKPKSSPLSQRLKAVWVQDWTRLAVKLQAVNMAFLGLVDTVNTYVSDPTFKSYLDILSVPKEVYIFLAIIGMISFISLKSKNA